MRDYQKPEWLEYLNSLVKQGYDVRVPEKYEGWALIGAKDGNGLIYAQMDDMEGITLSTVHYPSYDNGTGSRIPKGGNIDNYMGGSALYRNSNSPIPKTYKNIDEYASKHWTPLAKYVRSNVFTMADWKGSFDEDCKPFFNEETLELEISEDVYDNFMNSVPPIMHKNCFQNSEAYCHNSANMPMFYTFQKRGDRFFYLGIMTQRRAAGV